MYKCITLDFLIPYYSIVTYLKLTLDIKIQIVYKSNLLLCANEFQLSLTLFSLKSQILLLSSYFCVLLLLFTCCAICNNTDFCFLNFILVSNDLSSISPSLSDPPTKLPNINISQTASISLSRSFSSVRLLSFSRFLVCSWFNFRRNHMIKGKRKGKNGKRKGCALLYS